ncbi:tetratricopeptide repeat protein [Tenacibaculum sp. 190524A05c]|uniref:tetratricopeptide repeat protein n=1 Tax=Tenacibaculum platacis TaxID=3137852 RepID=UPI0032B16960
MRFRLLFLTLLVLSVFTQAQSSSFALAENYFRNSEYEKATQLYKDLVNRSPYNTTYLQRLISCYQETTKFEAAQKLLEQKIKRIPKLATLKVMLGYNYERQQKTKEAEKLYQEALNSITKEPGYGGAIGRLFKEYNKLDLAVKAYKETSKFNSNANYGFKIAQIYGEKGDFEFMFNEYVDYLDKNDNYLSIVKRSCARYISDDSEDENNILFKKALLRKSASNPKDVWNDLLRWLFIKQKDYGKAFIQNKALYQRNNDRLISIFQLGEIAFDNEDYDTAKQCFDFTIEKTNYQRDKFNAIRMNLQIAVKQNDPEVEQKFDGVFKEFGINSNTFSIQVAHADYLTFKKNKPEQAKKVLETALPFAANKFQKARVKLKLADVHVYQSLFNKALIYYSQIQTQFKNHELGQLARYKVAQTSYFKDDFKWAKAQLKVLKGSATQLIANDAADLFLVISDNQPKDSVPSGLKEYAQADLLAFQNKTTESLTVLKDILSKYKGQPIEDEALFKQAELFVKTKQINKAIENYNQIIALGKEGILADDAYYLMAGLYENEIKDLEKAKEYYQKIIFDFPSSIYLVDARKKFRKLRGDSI